MHESSLMTSLMHYIQDFAAGYEAKRVTAIRLRIGALSAMSPEHFREHFEEAAKGGLAEGARLFVQVDPDAHSPHAQDILIESVDLE